MTIGHVISLSKIQAPKNTALIKYMANMGITPMVCQKYLKELKLYNREEKKHFITFGILNEDEGYELQNEFYSGWINSERDVSFIRGQQYKPNHLHVFFHTNDFLAMVSREKSHAFIGDAIILHDWNLLQKIPPYLYQYNYKCLVSWMPNNDYGTIAKETIDSYCLPERVEHLPMNKSFSNHETIREWCASNPLDCNG